MITELSQQVVHARAELRQGDHLRHIEREEEVAEALCVRQVLERPQVTAESSAASGSVVGLPSGSIAHPGGIGSRF